MLTIIESSTRLGPSMDPAMALQYTKLGPLCIGYIFAFYATKMVHYLMFYGMFYNSVSSKI